MEEHRKTKVCSKCGRELPLSGFARCTSSLDGLQYKCRACANEYQRKRYAEAKAIKNGMLVDKSKPVPLNPKYASMTPREIQQEMRELKAELIARGFEVSPLKIIYKQEVFI